MCAVGRSVEKDRRRVRNGALLVNLIGMLMVTACSQPQQPSPTTSWTTFERCPAALAHTLGCEGYRSMSAIEDGASIEWVAEGAIVLRAMNMDGTPMLVIETPCNTLNIPVRLRGSIIVPGAATATLKACDQTRAAEQAWVEKVFASDVDWARVDGRLEITGGDATIVFGPDE